jgi:hypothetical protein
LVEKKNLAEALWGTWPFFYRHCVQILTCNKNFNNFIMISRFIMTINPWLMKGFIFCVFRYWRRKYHILGLANTISYLCGNCSWLVLPSWGITTLHHTSRHKGTQYSSWQ